MLKIALCDDDAACLERTAALVNAFFAQRPEIPVSLTRFGEAQDLLDALERGEDFDLHLLDVLMPGLNGIEMGKAIRRLGRDGAIIYLTTSPDYALDSYQARAFYYLLKPLEQERFFQVLDEVVDVLLKRQDAAIIIHTAAGLRSVPLADVLYVERVERFMRYYLAGGETVDSRTLRGSFREGAATLLADERFALCGASFVLGLHHVKSIERGKALLDTGERVSVSMNACAELKRAWMNYWPGGDLKP